MMEDMVSSNGVVVVVMMVLAVGAEQQWFDVESRSHAKRRGCVTEGTMPLAAWGRSGRCDLHDEVYAPLSPPITRLCPSSFPQAPAPPPLLRSTPSVSPCSLAPASLTVAPSLTQIPRPHLPAIHVVMLLVARRAAPPTSTPWP